MCQMSDSDVYFEFSEAKKRIMEMTEKQDLEKKKLKP